MTAYASVPESSPRTDRGPFQGRHAFRYEDAFGKSSANGYERPAPSRHVGRRDAFFRIVTGSKRRGRFSLLSSMRGQRTLTRVFLIIRPAHGDPPT